MNRVLYVFNWYCELNISIYKEDYFCSWRRGFIWYLTSLECFIHLQSMIDLSDYGWTYRCNEIYERKSLTFAQWPVKVWFQNARAKFRRGQSDICGESRGDDSVNGDGGMDQSILNDEDANSNDDLTSDTESQDDQKRYDSCCHWHLFLMLPRGVKSCT